MPVGLIKRARKPKRPTQKWRPKNSHLRKKERNINGTQITERCSSCGRRHARPVAPANIGEQRFAGWRAGERGRRTAGRCRDGDDQRRQFAAQRSGMDEGARRSHGKPALWNAIAVREERCQEHLEETAAIPIRFGKDAAAGPRWHHHAERAVLRTPSWRGSPRRSRTAAADAAWPGGPAF